MLEIYNEEYKDLLAKRPKAGQPDTKKHTVGRSGLLLHAHGRGLALQLAAHHII